MTGNIEKHFNTQAETSETLNEEDGISKGILEKLSKIVDENKIPFLIAILGFILLGLGVFLFKNTDLIEKDEIEIINQSESELEQSLSVIVEISGSVIKPGVYTLKDGARINDLMIASGGLSADADRDWVEKNVNLASKLIDGQKLYIRSVNEQTESTSANNSGVYQNVSTVIGAESSGLLNINTASFEELDKLPGIGQVYGQNIIDQRPYSSVEDLLNRKVVPKSTYEKIKDLISVY